VKLGNGGSSAASSFKGRAPRILNRYSSGLIGDPMDRIFQAISGIFSFETLFVLYLFAGQYKKDDIFKHYLNIPDLTPVLFAASVALGLFILIVKKLEIKRQSFILLFTFLMFICYSGLSLSWSNGLEYGATKTMYLGFQNFWNLIAATIIIVPDQQRMRRLMFGLLLVSIYYAGMSLIFIMSSGSEGPIGVAGSNYDGVAFIICAGISVLICYIMDSSQNRIARVSSVVLCCIYFLILLFVGHRGYLISTVLAMVALVFLILNNQRSYKNNISISKNYIIFLILSLLSMIVILQLSGKEAITVSRLLLLSEPSQHSSSLTRLVYYKEAFRIWTQHPIFGSGIGSFPILIGLGNIREYPHNFILEILAELGLVGLLIYGLLLVLGVRMLLKNLYTNFPLTVFVFLLFMSSFTEALFSSDISDHRLLMLSLGLMMLPEKIDEVYDRPQAHGSILLEVKHEGSWQKTNL
jgi:O-antigen ligase